jgi:hypothetical protein
LVAKALSKNAVELLHPRKKDAIAIAVEFFFVHGRYILVAAIR